MNLMNNCASPAVDVILKYTRLQQLLAGEL